mgnify:CR=1 FL=1
MIIDTHAHIDMAAFDDDRSEVIQRAKDNGVDYVLNVGCDIESSLRSMELAERYDFIYATAGVHPHDVKNIDNQTYNQLKQLLAHPKMIALGEIGLDFYKNYSPPDQQKEHLRKQVELSRELQKPIIIHCRDANDDTIAILSDYFPKDPSARSGIFHCFSGNIEQATRAIDYGNFWLGIGGVLTFKNAGLDHVVKDIDLSRLVLETDSPYLAPTPYRGKRNESSYLKLIATKLAEVKNVSLEEIAQITTANSKKIFGR